MMSKNIINEAELGKFLGSIDTIRDAFDAVSKTSSTYNFHTSPSGIKILTFKCLSSDFTSQFLDGKFNLVSSKEHKAVDFISVGEVNSSFSINEAAVKLFEDLTNSLKQLRLMELIKTPLVVTGCGLGGYVAILFALWLHQDVDEEESKDCWDSKRPVCITFGCPLVGDEHLRAIISKYPQWESRFLNVVRKDDRFASRFTSNSEYKTFGTFLFCMESGERIACHDQDKILNVLDMMGSTRSDDTKVLEYGKSISEMRRMTLYRGASASGEFNRLEYYTGLIRIMNENQTSNVYEPTKKLNDMKIRMTNIEGYMNMYKHILRSYGGIYDFFKNPSKRKKDIEIYNSINKHRVALNVYWKEFVEETKQKPQLEDAKMRKRWLYNGQNYRRMIEPLDIGDYYKSGKQDYLSERSNHYLKLEELQKHNSKQKNSNNKAPELPKKDSSESNVNNKAPTLTKDSCFWAHVEEASILLENLKNENSSHNAKYIIEELENFENKVIGAINVYSVSPDIFLTKSSFMKWWREYKAHKGSSYVSELTKYMEEDYKSYH